MSKDLTPEGMPNLTCPVCGKASQREDMIFTRDCHGITFRLVCFDCYDKVSKSCRLSGVRSSRISS